MYFVLFKVLIFVEFATNNLKENCTKMLYSTVDKNSNIFKLNFSSPFQNLGLKSVFKHHLKPYHFVENHLNVTAKLDD
jgi:hypothetical protein